MALWKKKTDDGEKKTKKLYGYGYGYTQNNKDNIVRDEAWTTKELEPTSHHRN